MVKLCVALDVDLPKALELVEELSDLSIVFKLGPKLFLEGGKEIIRKLKGRGCEVFLDLKLHDIPNTVKIAVEKAEDMGIDYLTLHTLGGPKMMEWASSSKKSIKLLGVTLLTSHDESYLDYIRSGFKNLEELVLYLGRMAKECGLDGLVASGKEVRTLKKETGLFVAVPGIRMRVGREDQVRVLSPEDAVREGADMLVVGRDVYRSEKPREVVLSLMERVGDGG